MTRLSTYCVPQAHADGPECFIRTHNTFPNYDRKNFWAGARRSDFRDGFVPIFESFLNLYWKHVESPI